MSIRIKIFLTFALLCYFPALAQVDTAWVRRYNGPGNYDDRIRASAVDKNGNVYVTGLSDGSSIPPYYDQRYATIKYAPNGDTSWIRRYDRPGTGFDDPSALAVDDSGNVYVTGPSYDGGNTDFATIKYAPNGDTLWVRRYDEPSRLSFAHALAVDKSGNVYVTGQSGPYPYFDYATIKYTAAGDTLWIRYYDGPGSGFDAASAIAIDDSENVLVTGDSKSGDTLIDYATIKYAPNGDTLWVRRYKGPYILNLTPDLAVDDSGNVYVSGTSSSGTHCDYATIKYAPNGDTLWVRRYGNGYSCFEAYALTVDNSHNVYVSGNAGTIKYFPNGNIAWLKNNHGGLTVDPIGNVYITGNSSLVKYSPTGDTLWLWKDAFVDSGGVFLVDDSGNMYLAGASGSYPIYDYLTVKYKQFACVDTAGDANGDGKINLADIIYKVNYVFKGGSAPSPLCRGDDNADTKVNLQDIIYEVNYVFKGGPGPVKSRECCL